jgi:hypothetical protein
VDQVALGASNGARHSAVKLPQTRAGRTRVRGTSESCLRSLVRFAVVRSESLHQLVIHPEDQQRRRPLTDEDACLFVAVRCSVADVAIEPIAAHKNVSDGSFAVWASIDFATGPSMCSGRFTDEIGISVLRYAPIHHRGRPDQLNVGFFARITALTFSTPRNVAWRSAPPRSDLANGPECAVTCRTVIDRSKPSRSSAKHCRMWPHLRGTALGLCSARSVMVIEAAEIFRCTHSYIGAPRSSPFMFVCHRCGHRAELLPLCPPGTANIISTLPFTQPNACTAAKENPSRESNAPSFPPSPPVVRDRPYRLRRVSGSSRDH